MKKSILLLIFIVLFKTGFTQQTLPIKHSFKGQSAPSVELDIYGTAIYIEGYDGDELTIHTYDAASSKSEPEEARGLANISSIAKYSYERKVMYDPPAQPADPKQVFIWLRENDKVLLIKVPRNIHLKLKAGFMQSEISKISLKDLTGELEINGAALVTEVNNVTGPITFSSNTIVSSKIIITNIKWPNANANPKPLINISAHTADVDISVPENAKATIDVNTSNGDIYSNLNLVNKRRSSNFSGDLNGGGPSIVVNTNYGNVFLRKQK
ncbi:MAG: hypothetical protein ABI367_14495 [Mucilaginibacter sp.]